MKKKKKSKKSGKDKNGNKPKQQTPASPSFNFSTDTFIDYIILRELQDEIKNNLDSMSELSELQSLRLQMAMDRMSKLMETLSNLLKKAADTQSAIIQNMKE